VWLAVGWVSRCMCGYLWMGYIVVRGGQCVHVECVMRWVGWLIVLCCAETKAASLPRSYSSNHAGLNSAPS
jgi:hypothetical protein